jgi:hypothetical protein
MWRHVVWLISCNFSEKPAASSFVTEEFFTQEDIFHSNKTFHLHGRRTAVLLYPEDANRSFLKLLLPICRTTRVTSQKTVMSKFTVTASKLQTKRHLLCTVIKLRRAESPILTTHSAGREVPCLWWRPKANYDVHKTPPPGRTVKR